MTNLLLPIKDVKQLIMLICPAKNPELKVKKIESTSLNKEGRDQISLKENHKSILLIYHSSILIKLSLNPNQKIKINRSRNHDRRI